MTAVQADMAADFIAGLNGGVAGVLVGHPFDTVKIRLQTQDPLKPRYNGVFHCFSLIARQETPLGLYKGMGTPIISVAFLASILFGAQGFILRRLDERRLANHALAGMLSGGFRSFVACPMEMSKIAVQLQGMGQATRQTTTTLTYSGSVDAFFKILRCQGLNGVYRGLRITLVRDMLGMALYFSTFEGMCRMFRDQSSERTLPIRYLILSGGFSGVCSWLVIYPLDVIKTRYQKTGAGVDRLSYMELIRESYLSEGARTFSRGLSASLIRAFPTCAAIFTTVSITKQTLANR